MTVVSVTTITGHHHVSDPMPSWSALDTLRVKDALREPDTARTFRIESGGVTYLFNPRHIVTVSIRTDERTEP